MNNCTFCKIISKELYSNIIYEDNIVLAFLDINPVSEGHLLIVPKTHSENIFDTDDETLKHINVICKKMGQLCKDKLNTTGINILNASGKDAQQSAFHLHYHVIPRYKNDGINLWFPENADLKNSLETTFQKLTK
jgi:histidine triad (HIT) family protein